MSVVLDAGALFALSRGDRAVRTLLLAARREDSPILIPPVVLTQTIRGGPTDAAIHRLLAGAHVPFVGKRLAMAAGVLLARAGLADAADAQVMAEAMRSAPSILLTSDPTDMTLLAAGRRDVRIVPI